MEGSEIVSDERRGRSDVLSKTLQGVQNCLKNKVFTGVCTSLARSNFDDLLTEKWIDRLIEMGVMYTWFHVYRPMGPGARPELCLTPEQQQQARRFVEMLPLIETAWVGRSRPTAINTILQEVRELHAKGKVKARCGIGCGCSLPRRGQNKPGQRPGNATTTKSSPERAIQPRLIPDELNTRRR